MNPAEFSRDRSGFRFSLYRPVVSGQLASHETSRPRNITLSQRAISNTPV